MTEAVLATPAAHVLHVPDPKRHFRRVAFVSDLLKRQPTLPFSRTLGARAWELKLPPLEVDRIEYELEVERRSGRVELMCDPANPLRARGPFGEKSVLELPGYVAPPWALDDEEPTGTLTRHAIALRRLRTTLDVRVWTPEGEGDRPLPLLVAHDGLEYAEYSQLLELAEYMVSTGELGPFRVALIPPPGDRDDSYSASAAYARAFAHELLPALSRHAPTRSRADRVGMGASLGALAMLHAHRIHPETFGALFLQSGSYFRQRWDAQEARFARFRRITRFVGQVLGPRDLPRPIPITMTCGLVEENRENNRAVAGALAVQGYTVRLHEHRDAHNWISWRDVFDPHLVDLLRRAWE